MKSALKLSAALAAVIAIGAIASCSPADESSDSRSGSDEPLRKDDSANGANLGDWGVDLLQRDTAVRPGENFYLYANGTWLKNFEMPADLSAWSSFTQLRLDAENDIREIVEELASTETPAGSLEQKVGDYYALWMNESRLNELGAEPLKPYLEAIARIDSDEALTKQFASLHGMGPAGFGIIPDPADTTRYIAFVGQSGLGLPDRDYYINQADRFAEYREGYRNYIVTVLTLAGLPDAEAKAHKILELETKIAEVHWSQEDSRDIQKIYNPMSQAELETLAPEIDWSLLLSELELGSVKTFLVAQPSAIDKSAEIFAATPIEQMKDYLAFHFIRRHAIYLSSDFDEAHFSFYGKALRGVEEQRERWKRGVNQIDAGMGEAVGKIYVERHFPESSKAQMEALVDNLITAFEERLERNDWMDEATREQALLKLSTFEPRIGYTEKWTDYSGLSIGPDSLLDNAMELTSFGWRDQVSQLGGPVDRDRWPYPPQTVNASYNPLLNQITFPAGILQAPFFDPNADPAVNYGAIGAVIGHEIGHGFDDQGRRFDEQGRIRDWWTPAANEAFQARADRLGAQYDTYSPVEGMTVNGRLTMGENIGDLGGMQMAYAAYRRHLNDCCDGEAPVLDGLTGDQRFFLGWSQVWQGTYREDELRQRLVTDPHSPPEYRINGVVRNMDAWYEAFRVTEDDDLYLPPEERVRIW